MSISLTGERSEEYLKSVWRRRLARIRLRLRLAMSCLQLKEEQRPIDRSGGGEGIELTKWTFCEWVCPRSIKGDATDRSLDREKEKESNDRTLR